MLRLLRARVNAHLAQVEVTRKPALRRTDDPSALLMTDLPRIASEKAVTAFMEAMAAEGWRVQCAPDWLLLDHDVPVPENTQLGVFPGERGCCVRLLQAHPGDAPAQGYIRALVKASDVGQSKVEQLCRLWHGEFAACLREHRPLPGALLPYLCAVIKEEER